MTPAAARARLRVETRRVRATDRLHKEALNRFSDTVETARQAGVTWPQIAESTGWAISTVRQKVREARRRQQKEAGQ